MIPDGIDLAGLYRLAAALGSREPPDEASEPVPPRLDMDRLIDDRRTRIIVCCGSGGVGKTTAAAAIGLRAAERGRQWCVLTVDPARRLAQSMGLTSLDNTPRLGPAGAAPKRKPGRMGNPAAACTR
jgi:Mrp family chromosome partitioning ATPase